MKIVTAVSGGPDARRAGQALVEDLRRKAGAAPDLIALYATEGLATAALVEELASAFPQVPIFGGTTCRGMITERGVHLDDAGVAAVLAISDPEGSYGAAIHPIGDDGAAAGAVAVERALERAGRPYESPALIWVCPPPGAEEAVLAGIAQVVGDDCPIIGGSSADDAVAGRWRQFGAAGVEEGCVSVAVLFPTVEFGLSFQSGYVPTAARATVTASTGRRVVAFDGEAAGAFYVERMAQLPPPSAAGDILAASTPSPLGRRLGAVGEIEEYLLIHPAAVEDDGALQVFADVRDGEELVLMRGDADSLVGRAKMVAGDASRYAEAAPGEAAGGLVIFCGGCMLAVQDRLRDVFDGLADAFAGAPFLAAFTFGEQGATITAGNQHGNLMVAASVFGRDPEP